MRLTNLFQRETDRLIKSFMGDNPDLLQKYVDGGLVAVSVVLAPLNVFMKHLLTVQGLDPEAVPGEKQRLLVQEALTNFFSKTHDEAFDPDYNLDWVQQKFEQTRGKLGQLGLTKEKFMDLTDVSKLANIGSKIVSPFTIDTGMDELSEINQIAPEMSKKEIKLEQERENKKGVSTEFNPQIELGGDAIQALREALFNLEKNLGISKEKKKKGVKVSKKKMNKAPGKPLRVKRSTATVPVEDKNEVSTLRVESDRKVRPPSTRQPGRNLSDLASKKRMQAKAAKESTPEFQAQLKAKLMRATQLTNLMVEKGLCEVDEQSRQDQITSMLTWGDNNFDALERVINRYAPTKDAVAENKFKGSFRRVVK